MQLRPSARRLQLAALALVITGSPLTAHAQFGALGNRLKKRVESAVSSHGDSSSASTPSSNASGSSASAGSSVSAGGPLAAGAVVTPASRAHANVVPLTADAIDRVLRGIAAERSHERDRQSAMAQPTTGGMNGYFKCINDFGASPEGEKLEKQHVAALRTHDKAQIVASDSATQRAQAAKCGTPEAAAASGTAHDAAARAAQNAARSDTTAVGAATAGMTARQFAVARERMTAFALMAGPKGACMQRSLQYVFSDDETAALTARRADIAAALNDDLDVRNATGGYCNNPQASHPKTAVRRG